LLIRVVGRWQSGQRAQGVLVMARTRVRVMRLSTMLAMVYDYDSRLEQVTR